MNTLVVILMILAVVFLCVGIGLIIAAVISRNNAKKAESWSTIAGQVTSSTMTEHRQRDSDGDSHVNYQPVVQYTYQVNGLTYNGGKISFGANSFDYNTAQSKVGKYPVGAQVVVHYNPINPGEAVLETQAAGSKIFLIIGIIFALIGLLSCCGTGVAFMFQQ
jgi:flagellar basal body-associated protein FliL